MSVIINPIEQYFDVDGSPLQSGYLYFGEVYGNPVTQPVMVYFDPDFTIPAAQPVRTVNGYPVRNGTATGLFAPDDVSILVQNSKKEQVIYIQSSAINAGDTTTIYRESNTSFNADDNNKTFIMLSAFTQTFDASANLGNRWRVNIINMSGGNVILNPYLSETIDGQATLTLTENQTITIYCDGVNLFTNLLSIKLVPDEAYNASTWNGSLKVPTQNAVRDVIEALKGFLPPRNSNATETLTVAEMGQLTIAAASCTKTLPLLSAVTNGQIVGFYNNAVGISVTISRQGSNEIDYRNAIVTSLNLTRYGDYIYLVADTINNRWRVLSESLAVLAAPNSSGIRQTQASATATSVSATTSSFTAPVSGRLMIWVLSGSGGTTGSSLTVTASLGAITSGSPLIAANAFASMMGWIDMSLGQSTTVTASYGSSDSITKFVQIMCFFVPS